MKVLFLMGLLAIILAISACVASSNRGTDTEKACTDSGGTVTTNLCCDSVSDFPNSCNIGACGCSPENSHEVKFCNCGEGKCWNDTKCA